MICTLEEMSLGRRVGQENLRLEAWRRLESSRSNEAHFWKDSRSWGGPGTHIEGDTAPSCCKGQRDTRPRSPVGQFYYSNTSSQRV